jgi:signal transduction histidine kinase
MKKMITLVVTILILLNLAACSTNAVSSTPTSSSDQNSETNAAQAVVVSTTAIPVTDTLTENRTTHEDVADYEWDSSKVIPIVLNGDSISVSSEGVTIAARQGVELLLELSNSTSSIMVDEGRMLQILNNLVENALRYTPKGGKITLLVNESKKVQLKVSDTGSGIDLENLPYVFDRFYRADKARGGNSGKMGLGLAICKALVTAQGGTIQAESDGKGTGSTFVITFDPVKVQSKNS